MRFQKYPKIAIFDLTAIGHYSATGQIKLNLFGGWPSDKILGVSGAYGDAVKISKNKKRSDFSIEAAWREVVDFNPDVIFYRPVPENQVLHNFSMNVIRAFDRPLVTWIVDDWPASLEENDPALFQVMDKDFRYLLSKSDWRCSISAAMSVRFEKRYGLDFSPLANGVNPEEWVPGTRPPLKNRPFKIRYAGSMAENMNQASFIRLANAVEALSKDVNVTLEVLTKPIWWDQVKSQVQHFQSISVDLKSRSPSGYRNWLKRADCVVILYNFDAVSIKYIADSFANKLPECLASGAPLLMHGPSAVATIGYVEKHGCAVIVNQPIEKKLEAAIAQLMTDEKKQSRLIANARSLAFEKHNLNTIRNDLYSKLGSLDGSSNKTYSFKNFERGDAASVDETDIVFELCDHNGSRTMLDVGGHFGGSSREFAEKNWKIFAFEPDPNNRKKFKKNLGHMKNVVLDSRAVGESVQKDIAFYASPESHGISGMLAFRDSHEQVTTVDVTTVEQIINDNNLTKIDFLKIDVEGYDFSVLKGVPWDRLRPDIIECEFEDAKTLKLGHTWKDICDYLVGKGYTVYLSEWHPIVRYGVAHDWRTMKKYPCTLNDDDAWGNLLAFKNDPGEAVIAEAIDKRLKLRAAKPELKADRKNHKSNDLVKSVKPVSGLTFGDRLRLKSPVLFRIAQFGKWCLGFFRRHLFLTLFAFMVFGFCVLSPMFFSAITPYKWVLWAISALVALGVLGLVAIAFANMMAHRIATRENVARADLKAELRAEILQEMKKVKAEKEQFRNQVNDKMNARFSAEQTNRREANDRILAKVRKSNEITRRVEKDLGTKLKGANKQNGRLQTRLKSLSAELENSKASASNELSAMQAQLVAQLANERKTQRSSFSNELGEMKAQLVAQFANEREAQRSSFSNELGEMKAQLVAQFANEREAQRSSLENRMTEVQTFVSNLSGRIETESQNKNASLEKNIESLKTRLETFNKERLNSTQELHDALHNSLAEVFDELEVLKDLKIKTNKINRKIDQTALSLLENSKKISEVKDDRADDTQKLEDLTEALNNELANFSEDHFKKLEALSTVLKADIQDSDAGQAKNLAALESSFEDQLSILKGLVTEISKRMDTEAQRNSTSFARSIEQFEDRLEAFKADRTKDTQLSAAMQKNLADVLSDIEELKDLKVETNKIKKEVEQTAVSLQENSTKISLFDQDMDKLGRKITKTRRTIAAEKGKTGLSYHHFNRVLRAEHVNQLRDEWFKPLGLIETKKSLAYAAERISITEKNLKGRLATSIENALLRTLIAKAVQGKKLRVLEIGVLFGVGLAIIQEIAGDNFETVHYTAIDPLEGYYGNNTPDLITHAKVNRRNLLQNMELANILPSQFTLLEGFSTEEEIIKSASKSIYDLLIIDGDHSYAGVKADFVNYAPFVKRGGYIIIDDDSTDEWPEITKYVDDELLPRQDIALVGRLWRSAVFRVIKKVKI